MRFTGKAHPFLGDILPPDFRAEIFSFVVAAWSRVKFPRNIKFEPRITGLLQHALISEQESRFGTSAPFFITEDAKRRDRKTGKEVERSDIAIHLVAHRIRAQQPYFVFESKRLNISRVGVTDPNVFEYVGAGGMGCLLACGYESVPNYNGMLAYVMDGNVTNAKKAVEKQLGNKSEELRLRGEAKIHPSKLMPIGSMHGETHHTDGKQLVVIFHMFLPVRS